jgi:hypothetical protein
MTRACPEPKVSRTLLMLLSESLMPEPSTIRYGIGNRLERMIREGVPAVETDTGAREFRLFCEFWSCSRGHGVERRTEGYQLLRR